MPNVKRNRKARRRREPAVSGISACAARFLREVAPLFRPPKFPRSRSARHLRNATIELLEAVRALVDEAIEWLRREGRLPAELKRIRIES